MSATPEQIAEPHSFSPDEIAQRIERFGAAFDLDVLKQAAALIRAQAERVRVLESEMRSAAENLSDYIDRNGTVDVTIALAFETLRAALNAEGAK